MKIKTLTLICVVLLTTKITAQKLPVLKISFAGKSFSNTEYTQGTMSLDNTDGTTTILPAKFKTRGATALEYSMKPSLNMKLRAEDGAEIDSALCGLRSCSSWILDAMAIDRICMRNRVCFDIWNAFSKLPYNTSFGSRNGTIGKFVEVYINDTYKGIYCLNDRINRKLLDLKKTKIEGDTITIRGVQYKHGTTTLPDQNTPGYFCDSTVYVAQWHDAWELSEPEDFAGIEAWAPLADYYQHHTEYDYISTNFYLENIVDYTLFTMVCCIKDNWGNKNQYFSIRNITADGNKHRFIISPWDLDTSLGGHYKGNNYDGNYDTSFTPSSIAKNAIPPFSTCLKVEAFKDSLKQRWIGARERAFSVDSVADRLYKYCNLFVESGAWERQTTYWDSQKYRPLYVQDLTREVQFIVQWYQDRFQLMDEYFGIEPTGITNNANTTKKHDTYYDLSGRPIACPTKGIYIHNGIKVVK